MTNVIAKKIKSVTNQITMIKAIRDEKAQHVHLGQNRWQTRPSRWLFREYDVILTILLEFSLRVATP